MSHSPDFMSAANVKHADSFACYCKSPDARRRNQVGAGTSQIQLVTTDAGNERGMNGELMRRMSPPPADRQPFNTYRCSVGVPRLDESVEKTTGAGGKRVVPKKMPAPGLAWLAYGKNTAGYVFGGVPAVPGLEDTGFPL